MASKAIGNHQQAASWALAFGISAETDDALHDQLMEPLQGFRSEIDLIVQNLQALGVPEALYGPALNVLRQAAAPRRMVEAFSGVAHHIIGSDIRLVVGWAAHVIPDEEEQVDAQTLDRLRAQVQELEDGIASASLPPVMRRLATDAVTALKRALALYPISGVRPVQEALRGAFGAMTISRRAVEIEAETSTPEARSYFSKVTETLKSVGEIADAVVKVKDGFAALGSFGDGIAQIVDGATKLVT